MINHFRQVQTTKMLLKAINIKVKLYQSKKIQLMIWKIKRLMLLMRILVSDIKLGWRPKETKKAKYAFEVPTVVAFKYEDDIYSFNQNQNQESAQFNLPQNLNQDNRKRGSSHNMLADHYLQRKSGTQVNQEEQSQTVLYQGFRPRDSLEVHESFRQKFYTFDFPQYTNLKKPGILQLQSIMKNELNIEKSPLTFDSFFEGGNLDRVVKINDFTYDLYLRPDTNTHGYCNWFYFKINFNHKYYETMAGGSGSTTEQRMTYRFNIVNMYKKFQLYCIDQKPIVKSKQRLAKNPNLQTHWSKDGISNVKYGVSKITPPNAKKKKYYTLSFTYKFEFQQDEVHIAYSLPYTYSQLQQDIQSYKETQKKLYNHDDSVFDSAPLCKSLSGLTIPLITITDFQDRKLDQKKIILINGRVHPGESNSSWIVHGLIQALLQNTSMARQLRSKFIFKIIPMINPDGVVFGNFRTCFLGKDMNRMFFANQNEAGDKIDERLIPEIVAVKKLIAYCQDLDKNKILGFFDIHQHSKRKSIFLYGPQYPLHNTMYSAVRVLPKIMSSLSEMFRIHSCRFRNEDYKENCARMFIERQFGIQFSYCLECSCQGFMSKARQIIDFDEKNLTDFGKSFAESLLQFGNLLEDQAKIQQQKLQLKTLKEQQKLETQNQLQQKRNENSKYKLEEKEKRQGMQIRSLNASKSLQKLNLTAQNEQSQDTTQSQRKSNGLIGGISNLGNLSLNDYISMMNSNNEDLDENQLFSREWEEDPDFLDDEENNYPSSGSDSENEEFSKEEQEQLYRDILQRFQNNEVNESLPLKKQSIRINIARENYEEDQVLQTQAEDQSQLSSRFQQKAINGNRIIDHSRVKSVVAQQISQGNFHNTNRSAQFINTSFASIQNDANSTNKFNMVLPVKQYEFGQKFKKQRGGSWRNFQDQLNNNNLNNGTNSMNTSQTSQIYPHIMMQQNHRIQSGRAAVNISINQSKNQLTSDYKEKSINIYMPSESFDKRTQAHLQSTKDKNGQRSQHSMKIRIILNSQNSVTGKNKLSLNTSNSQSNLLGQMTPSSQTKQIEIDTGKRKLESSSSKNALIHRKSYSLSNLVNKNNSSNFAAQNQSQIFKQQQSQDYQNTSTTQIDLNPKIRCSMTLLIETVNFRASILKLKQLRQRIKKKQDILQNIHDKIHSQSRSPKRALDSQQNVQNISKQQSKRAQQNINHNVFNSYTNSPLRNFLVFSQNDYMGFMKNKQDNTQSKYLQNNPVVFQKEKLKEEYNSLQPIKQKLSNSVSRKNIESIYSSRRDIADGAFEVQKEKINKAQKFVNKTKIQFRKVD
eukprot:403354471